MLKRFLTLFFFIVYPLIAFGQELPQASDDALQNATVAFDGQWLPDRDPAEIGANNFKTLQNMRYRPGGIEGVLGYSKINTSVLTPYLKARVGHHFKKDNPSESHVLYQAYNTGLTASQVLQNETAIPSQGDFSATALHTDATDAGLGRYSTAPDGMTYCNEKECLSWSGDEMPLSGFFMVTQVENATAYTLTFGADETIIDDGGGNFFTAGYKPGQIIDITGSASNDRSWTIKKIEDSAAPATNAKITVIENAMSADAADAGCTITARIETGGYEDVIEYTEAINNTLTTAGNVAVIGGGNDADTSLLLTCNGADYSTTFTDTSVSATTHTVTAQGDARVDTSQAQFGSASAYFDGTGDYLSIPDDSDFAMENDPYTADFWVKFNSVAADNAFFEQTDSATNYAALYVTTSSSSPRIYFECVAGSVTQWNFSGPWDPVVNRWYHVAVIRGWEDNPLTIAITIDGTAIATSTEGSGDSWPTDFTSAYAIGKYSTKYLNGWIDEYRLCKDVARWTANFTPPPVAYRASQFQQLVLSTRPLQGLKFYVDVPNTTASTTTGKVWNGNSFSALTITDGTRPGSVSLAQTGSMTFTSTVGEAEPLHFKDAYLFAYLLELSAGQAYISHVTGDAAFQPIVDVWDEVYRLCTMFQFYDESVTAYDDFTIAVSEYSGSAGVFGADIDDMTALDHIIVMFDERMAGVYFTMSSSAEVNTAHALSDIEYHDGTDWVSVGDIIDGTSGDSADWRVFGQSGLIGWNPPGEHEEVRQTLFGITGYAYRVTVDGTLSVAVTIDTVFGIPAQTTVKPFKFPAQFKDRTLLCGFTEGNEGNRIDFSMPGTSDVWNGELSSMDGIYSIRVPGQGDLTCGTELYNRYGSNVFAFWLGFMNTETYVIAGDHPTGENAFKVFPVSDTIGCPAPLTLVTATIGMEMAEDVPRQVAMWVSASGPMKFDGGFIKKIEGVDTYFDPASTDCITLANIGDAWATFNTTYNEWEINFPSDELVLVYAADFDKWYRKVPATYPKCGFPVYDTEGVQYIYAGLDTGYMMRLENGNTWDGTGIAQTVETGDFFPSQDAWHKTLIRQFKIAAKDITEAASLAITHYADTATSGTSLTALDLSSGSDRIVKSTQGDDDLFGWSHRFKFEVTTSSTAKGFQPLAWGYQWRYVRDDN